MRLLTCCHRSRLSVCPIAESLPTCGVLISRRLLKQLRRLGRRAALLRQTRRTGRGSASGRRRTRAAAAAAAAIATAATRTVTPIAVRIRVWCMCGALLSITCVTPHLIFPRFCPLPSRSSQIATAAVAAARPRRRRKPRRRSEVRRESGREVTVTDGRRWAWRRPVGTPLTTAGMHVCDGALSRNIYTSLMVHRAQHSAPTGCGSAPF